MAESSGDAEVSKTFRIYWFRKSPGFAGDDDETIFIKFMFVKISGPLPFISEKNEGEGPGRAAVTKKGRQGVGRRSRLSGGGKAKRIPLQFD